MRPRIAVFVVVLLLLAAVYLLTGGSGNSPPTRPEPTREDEPVLPPSLRPPAEEEDAAPGPEAAPEPEEPAAKPATGEWILTPVSVGPGPLLCVRKQESEGKERHLVHGLVDLRGGSGVLEFLRHPRPVWILARFDANRLLVEERSGRMGALATRYVGDRDQYEPGGALHVVDLPAAKHAGLLPGRRLVLLSVERGEAFFHDAKSGLLISVRADTPAVERTLFETPVRKVYAQGSEVIIAATAAEPVELWLIPKRSGPTRKVLEWDPEKESWAASFEVSPGGRHLAVGIASLWTLTEDPESGETVFTDGPRIDVVDLASGERRTVAKDLHLQVSPFSSSFPRVAFTWVTDRRIRFSETAPGKGPDDLFGGHFRWVDLDIDTGKRLAERRYSDLGLDHEKPPRDLSGWEGGDYTWVKYVRGRFRRDGAKVWFRGTENPAATALELPSRPTREKAGYVRISPDGQYAALLTEVDGAPRLTILDGTRRATRVVSAAWPVFDWVYDRGFER